MTTHPGDNGEALRPGDPDRLGPYRLTGRLGRGGMGTVYLGEDESGRRVAVKVINRELAGEDAFRERFRREVTAARQVRRFCTAPVLDAELDRDPLYVVTEYIEGPSLERAVRDREGPLPGSDLEGIAVGVATALAAIHGAGLVHRDLKPANVLLSATGPRVIDFGIARALDAADGPTRTGQFVGTPNYLPPEILRGEPITPASDVFSWGCVVAFAGTGSAPFTGSTVPEIFHRVASGEPKLDGLDEGLRDIVAAALDKDPRNRPSVQELLGRLVGNETTPDPATLAETVASGWPRTGAGIGAGVVGAGVQDAQTLQSPSVPSEIPQIPSPRIPGPPLGDSTRDDPPRPPTPAPTPSSGSRGGVPRRALGIGAAAVAVVALIAVVGYKVIGGGGPPEKLALAWADDYSSDDSGWNTFDQANGYINGGYRMQSVGTLNPVRTSDVPKEPKDIPERVLATVTVTSTEGPTTGYVGMECRSSAQGAKKYVFLMRVDGKGAVLRKQNGDLGTLELATVDAVEGFSAEDPSRLDVACEAEDGGKSVRLRFWVNGEQVFDATDDSQPLPNGLVALRVERTGNPSKEIAATFDDYRMSKILE